MIQHSSKLFLWLVATLIFFIPSNLFFVLNESSGYVNGLRIDYLLPKLFFTDLLIVPIITTGIFLKKEKFFSTLKKQYLLLLVATLLIAVQALSFYPGISFFAVLKGIEFSFLFLVLLLHKDILLKKNIWKAAALGILIQLIFSLYQFTFQKSLTPYWLSGESNLSSGIIGLARSSFGGEERLLAYGTTAHPNILAGITVLLVLIVLSIHKNKFFHLLLIPVVIILFVTQSWSAVLALAIGLIGMYKKNIFAKDVIRVVLFAVLSAPFVLSILSSRWQIPSLTRREELQQAAFSMLSAKPLFGVGLNNFTVVIEEFIQQKEFVRFIQPAHNSLWLFIAETGLIGILLLWICSKKVTERYQLSPMALALIPLLSLDHYLTTNQSGLLAATFFLVLCLKKISNSKL